MIHCKTPNRGIELLRHANAVLITLDTEHGIWNVNQMVDDQVNVDLKKPIVKFFEFDQTDRNAYANIEITVREAKYSWSPGALRKTIDHRQLQQQVASGSSTTRATWCRSYEWHHWQQQ